MTTEFENGRIIASEDGKELASCSAQMANGGIYLQDLQGEGAAGVIAIFKLAKELSAIAPVFFPLKQENEGENYKNLRRIARRMGAKPLFEMWQLGDLPSEKGEQENNGN